MRSLSPFASSLALLLRSGIHAAFLDFMRRVIARRPSPKHIQFFSENAGYLAIQGSTS